MEAFRGSGVTAEHSTLFDGAVEVVKFARNGALDVEHPDTLQPQADNLFMRDHVDGDEMVLGNEIVSVVMMKTPCHSSRRLPSCRRQHRQRFAHSARDRSAASL